MNANYSMTLLTGTWRNGEIANLVNELPSTARLAIILLMIVIAVVLWMAWNEDKRKNQENEEA